MPKLYELAQGYTVLWDLIDNAFTNAEELDADDLEVYTDTLDAIEGSIAEKVENIVKFIKSLEGDVAAYKAEEQRLAKKRRYLENKIDGLKSYMDSMLRLAKMEEVNAGVFKVKYNKAAPTAEVVDETLIPAEYREPVPDKIKKRELLKALKDLKDGEEIAGAKLITGKKRMSIT